MASLVHHIPMTTAKTTASMGNLAETTLSSSCSLSSRHQNVATPMSISTPNPSTRKEQPQISVEHVDGVDCCENSSGSKSHSVNVSLSDSTSSVNTGSNMCQSSLPGVRKPSNSNPGSLTRQNGSSVELQDQSHLQVLSQSKKKSFTLPLNLTLTGYSGNDVPSRDSSAPASSDNVLSETDELEYGDARHFIYEGVWKTEGVDESSDNVREIGSGGQSNDKLSVGNLAKNTSLRSELCDDDYDYYLSGSEMSFGDGSSSAVPGLSSRGSHDDDVFREEFGNLDHEADSKLVDWSFNVFVPACHTLLHHCAMSGNTELAVSQVLVDMRSLSNTINFFCSEQQRLDGQHRHGIRSSITTSVSTDRITRIRDLSKTMDQRCDRNSQYNPLSLSNSKSGSGFESQEGRCGRSYAVKILRSVSQSLIAPLLYEYEDGSTPDLYKSIVQAVQKIAWKVEACLSFNEPSGDNNIYGMIFDKELEESLKEMMIRGLPPEEPKLKITAGCSSRSSSMSTSKLGGSIGGESGDVGGQCGADQVSCYLDTIVPSLSSSHLRRTSHGRPLSGRFDSGSISSTALGGSDGVVPSTRTNKISTTSSQSPSMDTTGTACDTDMFSSSELGSAGDFFTDFDSIIRRKRMATYASPIQRRQAWHGVYDNFEMDAEECRLSQELIESNLDMPQYFRPKHSRRTTVSLSRKEVSQLGWRVAKKMDKFLSPPCIEETSCVPKLSVDEVVLHSGAEEEEVGEQGDEGTGWEEKVVVAEALASRLQVCLGTNFEGDESVMRMKSSSTSDLHALNCNPKGKHGGRKRSTDNLNSRRRNRHVKCNYTRSDDDDDYDEESESSISLQNQSLVESTSSVNEHLMKSYTPMLKQMSIPSCNGNITDDWTFVQLNPSSSFDSARMRSSGKDSKVVLDRASDKVKKTTDKVKKAADKSFNASGKFTNKVIKTAYALRRGTMSTFSKSRKPSAIFIASSMDQLKEDVTQIVPMGPRTSKSVNERPLPTKSVTLPTKNLKGTLSRLSRKSFSVSGSLPRNKKKLQLQHLTHRSGFLSPQVCGDQCGTAALTDSIYRFSKNAIQPKLEDSEEQLLISIERTHKVPKSQKKRASLISSSNSVVWYEITVTTNMKQFGRNHFTILRSQKQMAALNDVIASSWDPEHGPVLPDRPHRKNSTYINLQHQKLVDSLRYMANTPSLRSSEAFIAFLMPDDVFGDFSENSEISFDLLMTFYTPDMYPGPPGSHQEIQVVAAEDMSSNYNTSSPGQSRKQSSLQKRGTLHLLKKDGKEDNSTFVIREEGQDALIVACEDERYLVVAGTFEKLVEQLACEEKPDPRFVMTFLLGYRHFASPMELLSLLLRRFHMAIPPDATEEEKSYAEKWRYVLQLRVLDILTYWLKKCWPDFYRLPPMLDKVREFIEHLNLSQDTNFQLAGTDLEKIISDKMLSSSQYAISPTSPIETTDSPSSTSFPDMPSRIRSSVSSAGNTSLSTRLSELETPTMEGRPRSPRLGAPIDVHSVSAIQLARQLTLIELEYLNAIDIHELVVHAWEPNSAANKPYRRHIDEYIDRFNMLSYWISSVVCTTKDPRTRGLLLEKFIDVARHCQEYRNFNSTISIVSGLSLTAVRRLKKSWELVCDKSIKTFHKMCHIMSPTNNHIAYRKLLSNVHRRDACLPYFGVFMRDITFFNDGNHKTLKNGLLNFSKLRSMVSKFEELKRYQRSKYFFPAEDKTQEFCRRLWCLTESDLYEASEELEPRETAAPILPFTSEASHIPVPEESDV